MWTCKIFIKVKLHRSFSIGSGDAREMDSFSKKRRREILDADPLKRSKKDCGTGQRHEGHKAPRRNYNTEQQQEEEN